MSNILEKRKLLAKAKENPQGMPFRDLIKLAKLCGFVFDRKKGSHEQYKRSDDPYGFMNFQPNKKLAKPYQVRQLVKFVLEHGLDEE